MEKIVEQLVLHRATTSLKREQHRLSSPILNSMIRCLKSWGSVPGVVYLCHFLNDEFAGSSWTQLGYAPAMAVNETSVQWVRQLGGRDAEAVYRMLHTVY